MLVRGISYNTHPVSTKKIKRKDLWKYGKKDKRKKRVGRKGGRKDGREGRREGVKEGRKKEE